MLKSTKNLLTLTKSPYFDNIDLHMSQTVTITSKRQLTIPSKLFKSIGLSTGDKLIIEQENGGLRLTLAESLVERLAGSVTVASKFRKVDPDHAIKIAKKRRFSK